MEYICYFLKITLYPVAAILLCGFVDWACQRLFIRLLGHSGYKAVVASSIIGTPIHELGHAAMCLLFRHKIRKLVLWKPDRSDGVFGYVQHTYNVRSLYQRLGLLFIGIGPIFSVMTVLSLLLYFFFPATWSAHSVSVATLVENRASVMDIITTGMRMIPNMISEFGDGSFSFWVRIPLVLVMLSVSLHSNLSPADVKVSLQALPMYLAITLAVTVVTALIGTAATGPVLAALEMFSTFMMAMFTVVLTFALVQVALAMGIRVVLDLVRK